MDPGVEDHTRDGMPDAAHPLHARGRQSDFVSRGRGPLTGQQFLNIEILDVISLTDARDLCRPRHRGERNPAVMLLEQPLGQCVQTVHKSSLLLSADASGYAFHSAPAPEKVVRRTWPIRAPAVQTGFLIVASNHICPSLSQRWSGVG